MKLKLVVTYVPFPKRAHAGETPAFPAHAGHHKNKKEAVRKIIFGQPLFYDSKASTICWCWLSCCCWQPMFVE